MQTKDKRQLALLFLGVALAPVLLLWAAGALRWSTAGLTLLGGTGLAALAWWISGRLARPTASPGVTQLELADPDGRVSEELLLLVRAAELQSEPAQLYRWLTKRLAELMECEKCALVLRRPDHDQQLELVRPVFGYGRAGIGGLDEEIRRAGAQVKRLKKALVLNKAGSKNGIGPLPGERNVLMTLLTVGGQVVGCVRLANKRDGFLAEDVQLLNKLVSRLAVMLDNSRHYQGLQRRLEEMTLLYEVGAPLAASPDFGDVVEQAVEAIRAGLDCEQVNLFLVDESDETLNMHPASPYRVAGGQEVQISLGQGVIGRVAATGELAHIPDMSAVSEVLQLAPDARSELCVPLKLGSWVIGVVDAQSAKANAFEDQDVRLLGLAAKQLAAALQSSRLYDATRQRATELSLLYDATVAIGSAELDRAGVIELVMKRLISAIGVDGGRLAFWDNLTNTLKTRYTAGPTLAYNQTVDTYLRSYLLTNRKSLMLYKDDLRLDPDIILAMSNQGIQTLLILPLVAHNRVVGLVELTLTTARRQFSQEEMRLALTLVTQAAIALENARLYQETKRAVEELAALQALALDITSQVALPGLLDRLMTRARHLVKAAGSAIYLLAPTTAKLVPTASDLPWGGTVLQEGLDLAREVMHDVRPLCRSIGPLAGQSGARRDLVLSCGCVPLRWREEVMGVISVFRPETDEPFTTQELYLLELMAPQATIAVRNVHLFEALELRMAELEQAQVNLIQAEKAAAIGRLAASLAHEINNPLQSLNNCLHLSQYPELSKEKRGTYLSMAQEEVERLIAIVNRMLNFYRPTSDETHSETSVNQLLQDVLALVNKQLEHSKVETELHLQTELPTVQAVPNNLRQVFLNLILNSVDAMPDGGRLAITSQQHAGGWVGVTVSDTGRGIDEEHLSKIYEPFFTTKKSGTGLGLAISYGIIKAHNGRIDVISKPGEGTTFFLKFPIVTST